MKANKYPISEYEDLEMPSDDMDTDTTVQLMNGIEEVAQAVKRKPKETNEWQLRKDFKYYGVAFCQLAERNSRRYKALKCKEVGQDGTI